MITRVFKRCGLCNDIDGRENHLVRVRQFRDYKVPELGAPKALPLSKEEISMLDTKEKCLRKEQKLLKRKIQKEKREIKRQKRE